METKANYVLVGVFTLLVGLLGFGFVYWIAEYGTGTNTEALEIRIPGSVTGLSVGSQVLFNGIKVGDVRRLSIDASMPNMVIAETEVARSTPITRSTKASLGFQGLTGQAYIELEGGNAGEPNLLAEAEKTHVTATITAESSGVNNILATAQKVLGTADRTLNSLEGIVHDVRGPLTDTVNNAKVFSDALAKNSGSIDHFLTSMDQMSKTLTGVSGKLDTLIGSAQGILNSVNPDQVKTIVDNVASVTADLKKASAQLDALLGKPGTESLITQAHDTLAAYKKAADTINGKLDTIMNGLAQFSGPGLKDVQGFVNDSRRSLQRIEEDITSLSNNPQRIIFGGSADNVPRYDGRARH
jgi:phospholipid/cholesterol/gamma-HCH transport system substrate-binding protein